MPVYGEEKRRDMSRSLLPSSRRKGAKYDLNSIRRNARREARQALRKGDWDDEVVTEFPTHRIRYAAFDRRDGDNVAAIMRWAPKVAAHHRIEDRMSYVRSLMPDSIIGWHAMTHIRYAEGMDTQRFDNWVWSSSRRRPEATFEEVVAKVREVITQGRHKDLNRHFKNRYRPLLGLHDVEDWVAGLPRGYNETMGDEVHAWLGLPSRWNEVMRLRMESLEAMRASILADSGGSVGSDK